MPEPTPIQFTRPEAEALIATVMVTASVKEGDPSSMIQGLVSLQKWGGALQMESAVHKLMKAISPEKFAEAMGGNPRDN